MLQYAAFVKERTRAAMAVTVVKRFLIELEKNCLHPFEGNFKI